MNAKDYLFQKVIILTLKVKGSKVPYFTEKIKLKPCQDRRIKLFPKDKEQVRKLYSTLSQRALARKFNVSRRLIQFILYPEKLKENIQRRKERGGWRQYYDKEKNTKSIREHRRYKYNLLKEISR